MREFLQKPYLGSDGPDMANDFIAYLNEVLLARRWEAMSDHTLYLQGARQMLTEVIDELATCLPQEPAHD